MWLIEIPDLSEYGLKSRRKWLAPGQSISLGRHASNTISLGTAKSVSKQHCVISVGNLQASDTSNVEMRTTLAIEDLDSKYHTSVLIHGESDVQIVKTYVVESSDISVRLGKMQDCFKVYWQPFVLTLSNFKARDVQEACCKLDIRQSREYSQLTTHVLTSKYNTPKTLMGLIQCKFIVDKPYLAALEARMSQLQDDYDAVLPSATNHDYMPRDTFSDEYGFDSFLPSANYSEVFKSVEFVFFDTEQWKTLANVVQAGAGQALLYNDSFSESSVSVYLATLLRPVIVLPRDDDHLKLLDPLIASQMIATVTQGDFLRVILSDGKHAVYSAQRIPSSRVPETESCPPPAEDTSQSAADATSQIQTQSKKIGSRATHSLATFDEDIFGIPQKFCAPDQRSTSQLRGRDRKSVYTQQVHDLNDNLLPMFSSKLNSGMKASDHSVYNSQSTQVAMSSRESMDQASRARPLFGESASQQVHKVSERDEDYPDEEVEIAPAAVAFAKLKEEQQRPQPGRMKPSISPEDSAPRPPKNNKRADLTEVEILATIKANKERAEQKSFKDDGVGNSDDENLKNLGTVEYFELDLNEIANPRLVDKIQSDRWDPRWNGRKNFKLFRRPNKDGSTSRPSQAATRPLVIRLVESTPSDRSMIDAQWLETATTRNQDLDSSRAPKRKSLNQFSRAHNEPESARSARTLKRRISPAEDTLHIQQNRRKKDNGTSSTGNRTDALFLNDESDSDSDDDPLKFRLIEE